MSVVLYEPQTLQHVVLLYDSMGPHRPGEPEFSRPPSTESSVYFIIGSPTDYHQRGVLIHKTQIA